MNQAAIDSSTPGLDPDSVCRARLPSRAVMPLAAFGTFHSDWAQSRMKDATVEAIRLGWRHIDTARAYENESLIGEAIQEAVRKGYISSPNELFITGKLWNGHMAAKDVAPALDATLSALSVEQLDLYLNHWPWPNVHAPGCAADDRNPDAVPYIHDQFMDTWGEIVKLKQAGKVVDIGTSNHTEATMKLLLRDTADAERPVVNQMEMHPLFQQTELRRYFTSEQIICTGYMAVGSPRRPARDTFKEHQADMMNSVIREVANELQCSPGRVCLSWACQRENHSGGFVAMSTNSQRMVDNLQAATEDLLTPEQLLRISGDGSAEHPGIDANNRLIWGQVFLWPEANGDWRVLWDDSQVFETHGNYARFKASWEAHRAVHEATVVS